MSFGRLILIIIVIAVAIFAYRHFQHPDPQKEINSLMQPMFQDLVENGWQTDVIAKYADSTLTNKLYNDPKYRQHFSKYRRYGSMVSYRGIKEFKYKEMHDNGLAMATVAIGFEKANVVFVVIMLKAGEKWHINNLTTMNEFSNKMIKFVKDISM